MGKIEREKRDELRQTEPSVKILLSARNHQKGELLDVYSLVPLCLKTLSVSDKFEHPLQ